MKNLFLLILTVATFSSCKKANELSKFDINYSTKFTVPFTAGLGAPFNIYSPTVSSDSESKFQINSTEASKVESISLKTLKLTLLSPTGSNLGFVESVELYIKADGIDEEKIAWKTGVSSTVGTKLSLDVSGSNLKPYITSKEFQLRARTIIDEVITSDHEINVDATFEVDAKLFGS